MAELDTAVVTERVLRLRHARPFDTIAASELELLAAAGREVICSTRTTLVVEGERATAHWVALTGRLRAVRPGGAAFAGDRIENGFGGLSVLGERPMPCNLVADAGSVLLVLDADTLFAMLDENGGLTRGLLRSMASALVDFRGKAGREAPAPLKGASVPPEALDLVARVVLLRQALGLASRSIPVLVRLSRAARVEGAAAGALLWDPGRTPANLVVVAQSDGGENQGSHPVLSGKAFGMVESVAGVAMQAEARAATALTRLVVDSSEVQEVIEDDDRFCLELVRVFAAELWEEFWGTA